MRCVLLSDVHAKGSVRRPRDGDWRAGHVLLEVDDRGIHVRFVRIKYDVEAAARASRGRLTRSVAGPTAP
jgi:hypothetical protein